MVKKVACFFIALAAIVGILFLVHAKVDSYHGSEEGSHAVSYTHLMEAATTLLLPQGYCLPPAQIRILPLQVPSAL